MKIFIAVLFTIIQKLTIWTAFSEGTDNKLWYTQTTEDFSAIKKEPMWTHEAAWTNIKYIMLSGRSQSPKATYHVIPFLQD